MTWLKNFQIKKLFANKKFAVSFSVVVAFVFWLIIVIDQNPNIDVTFNNVPVSISATGTNLETLNMEVVSHNIGDSVSVTVNGPSYIVSSLKSDDLLVTADLSSVDKPGEYVLNLVGRKMSGKTDYSIVSINPSVVTITVDKMVDEYMDIEVYAPNVTVDVSHDSALGIEPFSVDEKIHIKGPQSEFEKIAKVRAVVSDTVALTSSKTFNAEIKLFDANGAEIDPQVFNISATNISVTAKIYKRITVPLVPTFINKPASASDLSYSIKLDSGEEISEIDIQGDPEVINSITAVELNPIDYFEISSSKKSFTVGLKLISETIKSTENIENVTVSFDLSGYTQKGIALDINVVNAPEGLTVDKTTLRSVTFTVPKNISRSFDANDVTATVDLAGKNAGDTVQVIFNTSIKGVWVNGSYTVSVKSK